MNEFVLVVVVVFSALLLELTEARADDICPPAGTSHFAKGSSNNYLHWKVTTTKATETEHCVEVQLTRVRTVAAEPMELSVRRPIVVCKNGDTFGPPPNDIYMHCMNGKAHHLQEEHAKPKVSYYAATYEQITATPPKPK
jgi:hypothetical protein